VAKDRVISTVDPDARHGHKTSARGFDGYKGHIGIDPDSEIITATTVTAGNAGDAEPAQDLLAGDIPPDDCTPSSEDDHDADSAQPTPEDSDDDPLAVYGDAAYGAGELLARLEQAGASIHTKVQPPVAPGGRFTKDAFTIDVQAGTVTCPAEVTISLRPTQHQRHAAIAKFGAACTGCPLAARCTSSPAGRTITISPHEAELTRARTAQTDPAWQADYKATRPKVERKIGHLMRRRHGGRRARVRGLTKVAADFSLLAAAINLARFGALGLHHGPGHTWATTTI
jgi:IS5 family transposase